MRNQTTPTLDDIERLARKRAGAKMGWYIHAVVYICVNIGLALLSGLSGRNWAIFPALGWGLGLLIHGMVVFIAMPGGNLRERLIAQERERLLSAKDPGQ
jgi:2TM domain